MKNSGSFAGLTLLAGLLAASSYSLLDRMGVTEAMHPPAIIVPTPGLPAQAVSAPTLPLKKGSKCVEIAQLRRAHMRAAYTLISQEGPVADGGDDAGFFMPPPILPDDTTPRCTGPEVL